MNFVIKIMNVRMRKEEGQTVKTKENDSNKTVHQENMHRLKSYKNDYGLILDE